MPYASNRIMGEISKIFKIKNMVFEQLQPQSYLFEICKKKKIYLPTFLSGSSCFSLVFIISSSSESSLSFSSQM